MPFLVIAVGYNIFTTVIWINGTANIIVDFAIASVEELIATFARSWEEHEFT